MPNEITTTVDRYIAMWNEEDPERRARLIEQAWTPEARYVDPLVAAEGHDGLSDMVAGVHAQFPGHRFARRSAVDVHHDQVRFAWDLTGPDGSLTVAGIDVATVDDDGRLRQVTGFFGEVETLEVAA